MIGPDPYLNGEGAFESITGIQTAGVQACAKHFVANNQEHWRLLTSFLLDFTFMAVTDMD
jgi:beta-glucosidase